MPATSGYKALMQLSRRFIRGVSEVKRLISMLQLRNILFCICLPLVGLFWTLFQPLCRPTTILSAIFYVISGIGITAGHHRLWSHRSFTASFALRLFLSLCAASSVQGSILTWCRDHRAHHRYVDTPRDPYNVQKGLLWSHMGWLIFKPDPKLFGPVDVSDLKKDKIVMWQHRHFAALCLFTSYALPCLVAKFGWNDGLGGLLYAGIIRAFLFQQSTNCVNSLAHYLGDQPYADAHSPRDHVFTALLTFGEGYHNFHHEFPSDYRNGIRWFDYDPTKWFITAPLEFFTPAHKGPSIADLTVGQWGWLGLASHLQEFEANEINKAIFQQKQKHVQLLGRRIKWGPPLETLPVYSWSEFQALCVNNGGSHYLLCIAGVIYDVESLLDTHPGGRALILANIGKDATASFHGGVYSHSKAASNLLDNMRFAVLRGGGKVEAHN